MRKIGAFIPARYAATRFPAKLMQMLGDKTVIRHTYDNTVATGAAAAYCAVQFNTKPELLLDITTLLLLLMDLTLVLLL